MYTKNQGKQSKRNTKFSLDVTHIFFGLPTKFCPKHLSLSLHPRQTSGEPNSLLPEAETCEADYLTAWTVPGNDHGSLCSGMSPQCSLSHVPLQS